MSLPPLIFEPYLRPQIWGGRKLETLFGKRLPDDGRYGESWEISGHAHHTSRVANGPLKDTLLTDLCRTRSRELFGESPPRDGMFPLLVKLLDCNDLLSIQVHPNDEDAARLTRGERGKTEAWVILAVEPSGIIYAGLKDGVTREMLCEHLLRGTTDQCLHVVQPKVGDCIFLPAGTVHAVGGGVVMAEVQQSSDATFRLFDWNRFGADGKPRALHIDESLASIDFSHGSVNPVEPSLMSGLPPGVSGETLVRCSYFTMDRYRVSDEWKAPFDGRSSIWIVLAGTGQMTGADTGCTLRAGECVLIPASCTGLTWRPVDAANQVVLLAVTLVG